MTETVGSPAANVDIPVLEVGTAAAPGGAPSIAAAKAEIHSVAREHGVVVVRGASLADADDFGRARDILIDEPAAYKEKATPRSDYGAGVLSSTDLPAAQQIRPHNEISYTLEFPRFLLFGCLEAPAAGGATPVTDVRRVLALLPNEIVEKFRRLGWLLVRNYDGRIGLPWQEAFATDEPAVVERYCADNLIGLTWMSDKRLRTTQRRSAIVRHPVTGEEVWFNHVSFWNEWTLEEEVRDVLVDEYGADGLPFNTFYGDGTPIEPEVIARINDAYDHVTLREPWQPGDLMLVDNILAAHARDPFRGSRRIVVAMGEATALSACRPTVEPSAGPEAG